ncbi:hypothetical protein Micbo1qcDRAFT_160676 [Microdochium bolleyi]|uniref:Uncharacterized protein n=1 Tax=Microdochium bolleyi TaxID=196109 RepID=A0A136J6R3_9PEZI|nr:hypothetical protein Micbo1qcDRAFT_160676 [Microdochium bolleyi]
MPDASSPFFFVLSAQASPVQSSPVRSKDIKAPHGHREGAFQIPPSPRSVVLGGRRKKERKKERKGSWFMHVRLAARQGGEGGGSSYFVSAEKGVR